MSERDNAIRFLSKMSCYFLSERVLIKVVCSCLCLCLKFSKTGYSYSNQEMSSLESDASSNSRV